MFWEVLFCGEVIGYSTATIESTEDTIAFDGFGLQNQKIITSGHDIEKLGEIERNAYNFPNSNGGAVLSKYYRGRTFTMQITIKSNTKEELDFLVDTVKKRVRKKEGNFDYLSNGETKRIKATCTAFDIKRESHNITVVPATLTFTTSEPFFYSVSAQSFDFQWQTGSFFGEVTNESFVESLPVFYLVFTAGANVSQVKLSAFWNVLQINGSFVQNDLLIIDCKNTRITKNGQEVDYTGKFLEFPPDSCPFHVETTWTAFFDCSLVVPKNFL